MKGDPLEHLLAKSWKKQQPPGRVLIIRMQAVGDVVLTFPLIQAIKNKYPDTEIDFLTRHPQTGLAKNLPAIHRVIGITNSQRGWRQALDIAPLLPRLFSHKYGIVIDLQRNTASSWLRRLLSPAAWCVFDRKGMTPATERYRQAATAAGLNLPPSWPVVQIKNPDAGDFLLRENGWDGKSALVVLNPAGFFTSRNWPVENYAAFARLWISIAPQTQFVVLGDARLQQKAAYLKEQLGDALISLQQKTTPEQAFSILSRVQFVLSEDSGLLWMAWVQKIPGIALFGSTPAARMKMGGSHIRFFTSSDLPCGDCFLPDCKFGDIALCLSRYTPEMLMDTAQELLAQKQAGT